MKKLEDLSLADVKTSLDFVRELKADAVKDSELVVNDGIIKSLSDFEEKLRSHLFYRVMRLKQYES